MLSFCEGRRVSCYYAAEEVRMHYKEQVRPSASLPARGPILPRWADRDGAQRSFARRAEVAVLGDAASDLFPCYMLADVSVGPGVGRKT